VVVLEGRTRAHQAVATLAINEGINSSVVVTDGPEAVFALQEERVCRVKNFMGFPHEALAFTLGHLGLEAGDIDAVCLSNLTSPRFTKESFYRWYDETADRPLRGSIENERARSVGRWIRERGAHPFASPDGDWIVECLGRHGLADRPVRRTHHHLNHAASAYFGLRPDADAPYLLLTLDGGGDGDCGHVYRAERGRLELLASTAGGHSLGQLYARVTHLMGMTPHEHEYKLMGLAPYADPERVEPLLAKLRTYLDLDERNPLVFKRGTAEPTHMQQPRLQYDFRRARFDTLSGAIQAFTEELLRRWVEAAVRETGIPRVLAAGGVFMNVKANKLIAELPEVEFFDVFPSCGDESLPFGAAWLEQAAAVGERPGRQIFPTYSLGPEATFDLEEARSRYGDRVEFRKLGDAEAECADLLAAGAIVARCAGRMEFGARALGNRSILADPATTKVVPVINRMIKHRDFWMPFAPAMLAERAAEYVVLPATLPRDDPSPFMMHTFDTTARRDDLLAGIHPQDGTARAQTVSSAAPGFHRVISEFDRRTGRAAVLNTSFNLHGFPIVMGACDAVDVLLRSSLENLMVEDVLVTKR
jgi:carbamoyltransferase